MGRARTAEVRNAAPRRARRVNDWTMVEQITFLEKLVRLG
jgi:hypothetical protein